MNFGEIIWSLIGSKYRQSALLKGRREKHAPDLSYLRSGVLFGKCRTEAARSSELRNSRTLPGHRYLVIAAAAGVDRLSGRFLIEMLEAELLHAGIQSGGSEAEQLRRAAGAVDSAFAAPQSSDDVFALATFHLLVTDHLDSAG